MLRGLLEPSLSIQPKISLLATTVNPQFQGFLFFHWLLIFFSLLTIYLILPLLGVWGEKFSVLTSCTGLVPEFFISPNCVALRVIVCVVYFCRRALLFISTFECVIGPHRAKIGLFFPLCSQNLALCLYSVPLTCLLIKWISFDWAFL